jgi:two-component system cell cycle sensor histidine kinase/response regulator CckA
VNDDDGNDLSAVPVPPDERGDLFTDLELTAGTGAYVWEPGRRLLWSEGFFHLLGIARDSNANEVRGTEFFDRVHPEDRAHVREHWAKALNGDPRPTRYRIVRPDGELRYLRGQGSVTRQRDGVPERIVGTIVDVTDVQKAIEDLSRTHTLLEATQAAAEVGSYVFEPATGSIEWSEALYRIYGVGPSTALTREFTQGCTLPEDLDKHLDWGRRLNAGESVPPLTLRIRRPDGTIRAIEARGRRLVDEQGRVRIVGICLDVTARRELEERLHQAAKMEAVGTLAAGVAHDFNNFLTVIVCQLDELRSVVSATHQAPLDDARHAAEQCALLTEKLLAFARKQPPSFSRLDLGATLRRVETLLRRVCPPSVGLTIDVPQVPVYVRSESNQLESLLMNLALNARDAMPNGGTLGVTVDQVSLEAGQAPLHPGAKPGRYARIQVKDTGIGISPQHLPRIFEPYFSTKAVGQGTGLGLASVYSSVRLHGGEVQVESKLGQGSTFYVFLPADSDDERSGSAPKTTGPGSLLANRHVLVVEDVDVVRRTVVAGLQRAGARVTAVTDGCHALEFLGGGVQVDIVLTDLIMPRMGGLELARELDKKFPELPIVFMSGYADHEVVEAIVRDHPDQPLLRKPFSVKELTDAISGALARSKTRP